MVLGYITTPRIYKRMFYLWNFNENKLNKRLLFFFHPSNFWIWSLSKYIDEMRWIEFKKMEENLYRKLISKLRFFFAFFQSFFSSLSVLLFWSSGNFPRKKIMQGQLVQVNQVNNFFICPFLGFLYSFNLLK